MVDYRKDRMFVLVPRGSPILFTRDSPNTDAYSLKKRLIIGCRVLYLSKLVDRSHIIPLGARSPLASCAAFKPTLFVHHFFFCQVTSRELEPFVRGFERNKKVEAQLFCNILKVAAASSSRDYKL